MFVRKKKIGFLFCVPFFFQLKPQERKQFFFSSLIISFNLLQWEHFSQTLEILSTTHFFISVSWCLLKLNSLSLLAIICLCLHFSSAKILKKERKNTQFQKRNTSPFIFCLQILFGGCFYCFSIF